MRKPDPMFLISVITLAGVLLTSAVQAYANNNDQVIDFSKKSDVSGFALKPFGGSHVPRTAGLPKSFAGFSLAVSYMYEGIPLGLTMGSATVPAPAYRDQKPAGFALVGVKFKLR